jgi:hypothetical protein
MPYTKEQRVNLALTRLGETQRIISLTEESPLATLVNSIYDLSVEDAIGRYNWSAATFRASLAQLAEAPLYEYAYRYALPTDPRLVRLLTINDSEVEVPHRVENNTLLTDCGEVNITYLGFIEEPGNYGYYLGDSISWTLVKNLTYVLTGDKALQQQYREEAEAKILENQALDGQQSTPVQISTNRYVRAHRGYSEGYSTSSD